MPRYAIIVAAKDYANFPSATFAHNDGRLIADTLVTCCDYAEDNVLTLLLDKDSSLTPKDLLERIQQLIERSEQGDTLAFYFAGHGRNLENQGFLLLPSSEPPPLLTATAVSLNQLGNIFQDRWRSCIQFIDACHSGFDPRDGDGIGSDFQTSLSRQILPEGWAIFSACSAHEKAYPDDALEHGIFTHHLCSTIRQRTKGSEIFPESLKIDVTQKVIEHASKKGHKQTPSYMTAVSGNISIATRVDRAKPSTAPTGNDEEQLLSAVQRYRAAGRISNDRLEHFLSHVVDHTIAELKEDPFGGAIDAEKPAPAGKIEAPFEDEFVEYLDALGLSPRHHVEKYVVEEEQWAPHKRQLALLTGMELKPIRVTRYILAQDADLPPSIVSVNWRGDDKAVPNVYLLFYVLPLQISALVTVGMFFQKWSPPTDWNKVRFWRRSLTVATPDDDLVSFSKSTATAVRAERTKIIQRRVRALENETKVP